MSLVSSRIESLRLALPGRSVFQSDSEISEVLSSQKVYQDLPAPDSTGLRNEGLLGPI